MALNVTAIVDKAVVVAFADPECPGPSSASELSTGDSATCRPSLGTIQREAAVGLMVPTVLKHG